MDFNTRFPLKLSSVYKITSYGLSLHTQEYARKYLDEATKESLPTETKSDSDEIEDSSEIKDKKTKLTKSKIDTNVEDKLGNSF